MQLVGKTRITFSAGAKISLIHLDTGMLIANISAQPEGRKLIFTTPQAVVRVVGTQFELSAEYPLTTIRVDRGKVVLTAKEDQKTVVVSERKRAIVGNSIELFDVPADGQTAKQQ
jgi:ferric-dicitrate binding protein FerR (iron transport regulator)